MNLQLSFDRKEKGITVFAKKSKVTVRSLNLFNETEVDILESMQFPTIGF